MGMANGMIINVVSSKRKNAVLMRYCKGGKVSVNDGEYFVTSDSKTKITGCKFKLYVHLVDGKWRIRVYPGEFEMHNHELFDEDHPTRGLSDGVKQLIQGISKDGCRPCQIMAAIERIFPDEKVNRRQVYNFRKKLRNEGFPVLGDSSTMDVATTTLSVAKHHRYIIMTDCNQETGAGTSITLKHIHPFWATLNIGEQAGTSAPSDMDDDVLYTRQLMEELNECPKAVRRTVNRALHDMHPDQCGFKEPEEVKRRKGRPKGAKSKKKAEANTFAHEQRQGQQSPQKKVTHNVWDYRDETQEKSTTGTSDSSKKAPLVFRWSYKCIHRTECQEEPSVAGWELPLLPRIQDWYRLVPSNPGRVVDYANNFIDLSFLD
ncbi:OLC1v1019361C1 [Oldenlandia corymbosa var. corymbosa]|uniref:OLC1v1019361C1 n=1 Tax=Oldenlandia corymbosa var. corymbosa TaxID=529605 RepID=A0AAV1EDV7_OLDCO|nr:OLC1v1019361C1 [Oldenlandia corymbosa var. corymbosa]